MKREELLEKMFALKAMKPWNRLNEFQMFAMQMKNRTWFIEVQGIKEEYAVTINVYPEGEGLRNYVEMKEAFRAGDHTEFMAGMFAQDGPTVLQCSKEQLDEEEQQGLRDYAKAHGLSLRGKNAWFRMMCMHRYQVPTTLEDGEDDTEILGHAMDAVLWLVGSKEGKKITLSEVRRETESILFLRRELNGYSVGSIPMPQIPEKTYPVGKNENIIYQTRVKKLKKKGTWQCKLVICTEVSGAEGVEGLHHAWRLLTWDQSRKQAMQVQRVRDYENRTEVMLDKLMETMEREKFCPKTIEVYDERTEALFREWCPEMKIGLSRKKKIPDRIEAMEMMEYMQMGEDDWDEDENWDNYEMQDFLDDDDDFDGEAFGGLANGKEMKQMRLLLDTVLDVIEMAPDEVLLEDPDMLNEQLLYLALMDSDQNVPAEKRRRIRRASDRVQQLLSNATPKRPAKKAEKKTGKKKKETRKAKDQSYVISASLGTGCYRHIRISGQDTLEELSDAILDAFNFDNDHAHAFYLDNHAYSNWDCYYVEGFDPNYPTTGETTLTEAGLEPNQKFKYLFDFGDKWIFQCKVLKLLEEETGRPMIVREKGEAPVQYPDWDDEEWEDGDWDEDD